jgi:hypothetical protein
MAPEGGESVADVARRLAGVLSSTDMELNGYLYLHAIIIQMVYVSIHVYYIYLVLYYDQNLYTSC